ncbi:MAG TPA: DUF6089 family protein [Hanamia sp.]
MKIVFLSIIFVLFSFAAGAQKLSLDLYGGISNYMGDLQGNAFLFSQSHIAGGAGLSYQFNDHIYFRTAFILGKVSGSDKDGSNKSRNLNFTSDITEGNLEVLYFITPLHVHSFSPYLFTGISVYHFNPYTHDTLGNKYYLKPLSTEGEGFLPGVKNYSLTQLGIPIGGGVKLRLSENVDVGLEIGIRKLFTDYLDDVSSTYADEGLLLANRGSEAVELAYRGDELKGGSLQYPAAGKQRGSPKAKDMYYFTLVSLSYRLGAFSSSHSQWSCPKNVL